MNAFERNQLTHLMSYEILFKKRFFIIDLDDCDNEKRIEESTPCIRVSRVQKLRYSLK